MDNPYVDRSPSLMSPSSTGPSEETTHTATDEFCTPGISPETDWVEEDDDLPMPPPAARSVSLVIKANKAARVPAVSLECDSGERHERKTVAFQDTDVGRLDLEGSDSHRLLHAQDSVTDSSRCGSSSRDRKMSLIGKPLSYKNYRTDQRFRRMQTHMHNFLERPRGWRAASYHLAVLVMVLMCLALSVFSTMPDFEEEATMVLYYLEIVFVFWLAVEYVCRVWSAGCRSRYRGLSGRIRFATSAYCVIDIIVILASITVLCIGATGQVFAASAIRGLRFFQILRMLRIDRRAGTWKLLGSVVWAHRQELLTTVYIGFLGLIFSSFLVYLCEKNTNDKYSTFADALWWGVITLSTVGYGDKTPETWPGKIIAAFCALLGISFFALPAGILGSGFALKVQQHQRQKHLIRRRVPAARLIQCLWRHYSAAPESCSLATWKVHLAPQPSPVMKATPNGNQNSIINRIRQSTRRRTTTNETNPSTTGTPLVNNAPAPAMKTLLVPRPSDNISVAASDCSEIEQLGTLGFSIGNWRSKKGVSRKAHDDSALHNRVTNVNSIGNMDIAARRRRHRRSLSLCASRENTKDLPLARSEGRLPPPTDYNLVMAPLLQWCERQKREREENVWSQLAACAPRRSLDSAEPTPRQPAARSDATFDEEFVSLQPTSIEEFTPVIKNAVRAIRRIQLLVARRKFKEALKPYDVKDVIEQYSAGHVDLQSRVKHVQQRLDLIVGKPADKNEIKVSLASRVIHVERQVDRIDRKLDLLLETLLDRSRPSPPHSACGRIENTVAQPIQRGRHSADSFSVNARERLQQLQQFRLQPIQRPAASSDTLEMFTARSRSPVYSVNEGAPLLRNANDVAVDIDDSDEEEDE